MSEIARAMMNTSVASIFLRLRKRTTITRRLRKKLTSTAMQSTMREVKVELSECCQVRDSARHFVIWIPERENYNLTTGEV